MDTLIRPTITSRLSDLYWQFVWNAKQLSPGVDTQALLIGDLRPLWRDYSYWQGLVNHGVAVANGVVGMAARSGISWGYQDPTFPHNWKEAGEMGEYRTSYHVPYHDQPLVAQLDNWYRVHPEIDVIPRIDDMELLRGKEPSFIANFHWGLSEKVLARDGVRPWIYSRRLLIDAWLDDWTQDMIDQHYFILAEYLWDRTREHPGPPTLPKRVKRENVIMHQCADKKGSFPGETPGSYAADYDRWEIGNEYQMHQWIDEHYGSGTPPPPPAPAGMQFRVTVPVLNVRSGPGTNFADIGDLHEGDIVTVKDIGGDSAWIEFDGGWCAVEVGVNRFMEPVK